jgi:hypothetical protein
VPELERLLQQTVHEGGLAMIDVRDNSDVAVFHVFS